MADKQNPPKFEKEIEVLDQIYNELVEAIHEKPENQDVEQLRIYVDNTYATLNRTVLRVKEIKNGLTAGQKLIHETWNPPA